MSLQKQSGSGLSMIGHMLSPSSNLPKLCCVNLDMKHTGSIQYPESHTPLYSYYYIFKASKPDPHNP